MFLIGKYLILHRQKYTGTIDQVNDRKMIFHGDFLQAQVFFAGNRKPGTGLYSLVIGNNDTLPATHISNTGYCTTRGATTLFYIHFITCKCTDFNKCLILVR